MDLKNFIADSIRQVFEGVVLAQEHAQASGGFVNPGNNHVENPMQGNRTVVVIRGFGNERRMLQSVEFDVAVVVTREVKAEGEAGGGVVSVVSVSGTIEGVMGRETTSRVKFDVPIVLPLHRGSETFKPKPPIQPPR